MTRNCLSRQELSNYCLGTLEPERADGVADHVEQCPLCESTLRQLEALGDTLFSALLQSPGDDAYLKEPGATRAVELAVATVVSSTSDAAAGASPAPPPIIAQRLDDYRLLARNRTLWSVAEIVVAVRSRDQAIQCRNHRGIARRVPSCYPDDWIFRRSASKAVRPRHGARSRRLPVVFAQSPSASKIRFPTARGAAYLQRLSQWLLGILLASASVFYNRSRLRQGCVKAVAAPCCSFGRR